MTEPVFRNLEDRADPAMRSLRVLRHALIAAGLQEAAIVCGWSMIRMAEEIKDRQDIVALCKEIKETRKMRGL